MAEAKPQATVSDINLRTRLTAPRNGWAKDAPRPTRDDLDYARILTGDPCAYCGNHGDSIDHIVHDQHNWANLTATCKPCNSAKGQHSLIRFLLAQRLREQRQTLTSQIAALGPGHGRRGPLVPPPTRTVYKKLAPSSTPGAQFRRVRTLAR